LNIRADVGLAADHDPARLVYVNDRCIEGEERRAYDGRDIFAVVTGDGGGGQGRDVRVPDQLGQIQLAVRIYRPQAGGENPNGLGDRRIGGPAYPADGKHARGQVAAFQAQNLGAVPGGQIDD
jgi:hypothetical protein